jgi:hypothetical protein
MNQQVTALIDANRPNDMNDSKHASQGQFAYFANPANLWPDFLLGQADQPLRVILIEEDAHMRSVVGKSWALIHVPRYWRQPATCVKVNT